MTEILRLSLPFTVWLVGFSALYGLQGLTCSRHWPEWLDARLVLIVAAVVFVAAQGMVLRAILGFPSASRFVQTAASSLAAAALAAALWVVLPVLAVTVCS